MDWICVPSKFLYWNINLQDDMTVLGVGTFERWLGSKDGAYKN